MIAAAVIIGVLVLILLLRFGAQAEYGAEGIKIKAQIGALYIQVYPSKPKKPKQKKRRETKKAKKEEIEKPGKLIGFSDLVPSIKKALSRLRRRLLIKKLTVYYASGSDNAFKTAMSYGASNLVFGTVSALLDNSFRVKERDFRAHADFTAEEPYIYINAAFSLAVWEAIYISLSAAPLILKNKSKERKKNGKASNR